MLLSENIVLLLAKIIYKDSTFVSDSSCYINLENW